MSDVKIVLGIFVFIVIVGLFISNGVHETISEAFEGIQPDENSNFQQPFSSEILSFLIIFGIALTFALKIMQE
ncbi:MAG: hypothetical protein AB3K77_11330 [Methanosarcinaceae archaeon]